jgi:hypothetical protein
VPLAEPAAGGGGTPAPTAWARIVSELADLQDPDGAVVNLVCGRPYVVDTCCAAAVFAAEHRRTGDERWRARAGDALAAARAAAPFRGVDEPVWDGRGWSDVRESLPATAIAVDAYREAAAALGLEEDDRAVDLLALLRRCRTRRGGYAHDAPAAGRRLVEVQNATACALHLLGGVAAEAGRAPPGVDETLARLRRGQASSGFWPYRHPGARARKALDAPLRIALRPRRFFFFRGAGDLMHHALTLHFAAGYAVLSGDASGAGLVASGWGWLRGRLVPAAGRSLSIDWSGDPVPTSPRCSNARDTNAYFLVLGTLPRLRALGIVGEAESAALGDGLLAHVAATLVAEPGRIPCVAPHEGPAGIVGNLLPMFEQSVAWKGRLMAALVTG